MPPDTGSYTGAVISGIQFHLRRYGIVWLVGSIGMCAWGWVGFQFLIAPPDTFPESQMIVIETGETPRDAALQLAEAKIIRHPNVFYLLLRILGREQGIRAGMYEFDQPETALRIASRLIGGDRGVVSKRITFPEGFSVREMAERTQNEFPLISKSMFESSARSYEGYLFPDTYLFAPDVTAESMVKTLRTTFDSRIASLMPEISASTHTLAETVTMASLIEKEARTTENRRIISGILWRRLALHMPLQVDAVFGYIFNRSTYSPTLDDLKIDSPYNTYTHQGLPPAPINNPGLDALSAAVHPIPTDYLYYLVDAQGVIHYAKTFVEHKANREKYL